MATQIDAPILSFPAILRNPGLNDRFAHLHLDSSSNDAQQQQKKFQKNHRHQNEGKRWVRRKDNARFVGNPHIVTATRVDYLLQHPTTNSTFPEPLPSYLPRSVKLPTIPNLPVTDLDSANAGRFSLSLKGMRRDLRKAGGRAEILVRDVESHIVEWLTVGGTILYPTAPEHTALQAIGTLVGNTGVIIEVSRTPLQLVWKITDDAFARYVVHCCARFHEVVSFSKGNAEHRLTYLLRPNSTRPDRRALAMLDTPPVTDLDYSSHPETEETIDSEFVSDHDLESDADLDHPSSVLPSIDESMVSLPAVSGEAAWTHVHEEGAESDMDEFESSSEFDSVLGASVEGLQPKRQALPLQTYPSISESQLLPTKVVNQADHDRTIKEEIPIVNSEPLSRRREWSYARSPSSPSRSPVRTRYPRRRIQARKRIILQPGKSFYEYLFS